MKLKKKNTITLFCNTTKAPLYKFDLKPHKRKMNSNHSTLKLITLHCMYAGEKETNKQKNPSLKVSCVLSELETF